MRYVGQTRGPYVISDEMPPTEQVDGRFYTSKARFRAKGRELGLVEVGNEKFQPKQSLMADRAFKEKRIQAIKEGTRTMVTIMKPCSRCGKPRDRDGQKYCRSCHAAYQREHRPKHSMLSPIEKFKQTSRSYAGVYKRRGYLIPQACELCGVDEKIQMHHENYAKPLEVNWLCVVCHTERHHAQQE